MENNIDKKIDELIEMVVFIKDNAMSKSEGATKEDLRGFATKEDLKGFATKEDLRGFATKDDLRGFATKEDLAKMETRLVTKSYLDDKLADFSAELGDKLNRHTDKEKTFKSELVVFLSDNHALNSGQVQRLKELY